MNQHLTERIDQLEKSNTELLDAVQKAETANRSKSAFLLSMSHELRNQLNAIIGFSRLMVKSAKQSPEDLRNVEIINRSGDHLLSLINDVLELSKIEVGRVQLNIEKIDLQELLHDLSNKYQARAEQAGLRFEMHTDHLPHSVSCDGIKLKQILAHLLNNAIKFTQAGSVSLTTHTRTIQNRMATIDFAVCDTGEGIAAADQKNIFDPFVKFGSTESGEGTGSGAGSGAGLGLTICKQYLQLMGSALSLESITGQGSTFRFSIQVEASNACAEKTPQHFESLSLRDQDRNRRVLVADDAPESRLLLCSLIDEMGFVVQEAEDGREAIALLHSFQPDLILMDWQMPHLDGLTATRQIRELNKHPQPVIIILSGNTSDADRQAALSAGANDFLHKPLDADHLNAAIEKHLAIQFIRTDSEKKQAQHLPKLTAADLAVLPIQMRENLRTAVKELNQTKILDALRPLAAEHAALVDRLWHLAEEFCFQDLWQLFEDVEVG